MSYKPPSIGNLILLGFEESARLIYRHTRGIDGAVIVQVDAAGTITRKSTHGYPPVIKDPAHVIGTYNRKTQIEVIEGDMLCRLRELTTQITGIAA